MGSKVQTIYFDPPYGIKYGSNFQPFVNKRDVKDGKDEDLTVEPEMIKAFRDTWELGIHSYLSYLRDRLTLAKDLLTDSGSIFVQISDENVHRVRLIMDEVFGAENFVSLIPFYKISGLQSNFLDNVCDYLLWYGKDIKLTKYKQLFISKNPIESGVGEYKYYETKDGLRNNLTDEHIKNPSLINSEMKLFRPSATTSQGWSENGSANYPYRSRLFSSGPNRHWSTTHDGMNVLDKANRLLVRKDSISYIRYLNDFPVTLVPNVWLDTRWGFDASEKSYVVQTTTKVIQRCILMTSDPGELVFDPTCLRAGTKVWVANSDLPAPLNFNDIEKRLEKFSPNSGRAFLDVLVHFSGLYSPLNSDDVQQYSEQFPPHAGGSFFGVAESSEVGVGLIISSRNVASPSLPLSIPRKSDNSYKLPPRAGGINRNSQTSAESIGGQNQIPLGGITRISQTNPTNAGGQQLGQYLPIEQLIPGNLVLSHDGELHKVIRTIQRKYSGIMVGLSHTKSDKPIWITSDHKVLTRKRNLDLGGHSSWRHVPKHHFQYAKENRKKKLRGKKAPNIR